MRVFPHYQARTILLLSTIWCWIGFAGSLTAQDEYVGQADVIHALTQYRTHLITQDSLAIYRLKGLERFWQREDFGYEIMRDLALYVIFWSQSKDKTVSQIVKKAKWRYSRYKFVEDLTEHDVEVMIANQELLALILGSGLEPKFPYIVSPDCSYFIEIPFYEIRPGARIAEIGAGDGTFSLMLGMLDQGLTIDINEVDEEALWCIDQKLELHKELIGNSTIRTFSGDKRSTLLPEHRYDRIIIRNALHHFYYPDEMLETIKSNLKADGKLVLFEPYKGSGLYTCPRAMTQPDMRSLLAKHGFVLEAEEISYNFILMRCHPEASTEE